jgi:hypothetical protein
MTSYGKLTKTKVIDLDVNNNFVVDNIFIRNQCFVGLKQNFLFFWPVFEISIHSWLVIRTNCDENVITMKCLLLRPKLDCDVGYDTAVKDASVVV